MQCSLKAARKTVCHQAGYRITKSPKCRFSWKVPNCGNQLIISDDFNNFRPILEDNKSRVSGRIQARLHRPLSRCHSYAEETELVIGWKLLSLGRPNSKISLLLGKWRHAFFENFKPQLHLQNFLKKLLLPAFNLTCFLTHCLLLFNLLTGSFILLKLLFLNTMTSSLRWIVVRPLHSFF